MTDLLDTQFLTRSIELAVEAGQNGNRPFGAVLVAPNGSMLAEGRNEVSSSGDVTAHAELVAIRKALVGTPFGGFPHAVMYASGEPCPMCAAACVWAGIGRIVFAASTAGFSSILAGGPHFVMGCAELVRCSDADVQVCGPVDEDRALAAMRSVWQQG